MLRSSYHDPTHGYHSLSHVSHVHCLLSLSAYIHMRTYTTIHPRVQCLYMDPEATFHLPQVHPTSRMSIVYSPICVYSHVPPQLYFTIHTLSTSLPCMRCPYMYVFGGAINYLRCGSHPSHVLHVHCTLPSAYLHVSLPNKGI